MEMRPKDEPASKDRERKSEDVHVQRPWGRET